MFFEEEGEELRLKDTEKPVPFPSYQFRLCVGESACLVGTFADALLVREQGKKGIPVTESGKTHSRVGSPMSYAY